MLRPMQLMWSDPVFFGCFDDEHVDCIVNSVFAYPTRKRCDHGE